ncbi:unnamed protein product [Ectocarpus sp. 4 AP-2014]
MPFYSAHSLKPSSVKYRLFPSPCVQVEVRRFEPYLSDEHAHLVTKDNPLAFTNTGRGWLVYTVLGVHQPKLKNVKYLLLPDPRVQIVEARLFKAEPGFPSHQHTTYLQIFFLLPFT